MRSIFAAELCGALLWAFLQAPFAHTHTGADDDDHHSEVRAHLHLAAALPAGPMWDHLDPDADAHFVDWFQGAQPQAFDLDAEIRPAGHLTALVPTGSAKERPNPRGHDPPLGSLPSRGPPLQLA